MSTLVLIRHGQASALSDNYDQLSDTGKQQSILLRDYFIKQKLIPQQIISGPLNRQMDTARSVCENALSNGSSLKVSDLLREHEGFQIIKSVMPALVAEDKEIQKIASINKTDRQSRIQSYLKIYEVLSTRWIYGDLDYDHSKFESWDSFKTRVSEAMKELLSTADKNKHSFIFSSGGPIAVFVGKILGLSDEKTLHLSWVIHNSSITELLYNNHRISLKSFNRTPHLDKKELVTIV